MRLYDCATVMRSKNAGPFTLTIDLMFDTVEAYDKVFTSHSFCESSIAELYEVDVARVCIHLFPAVRTIKVTMPRPSSSSGAPGDRDVYGCQQHFPLADMEIA